MNTDSRIIDLIEKAGGLTQNADTSNINLSKKLKDEMVIIIYSKEEMEKINSNEIKENADGVRLFLNICNENSKKLFGIK